MCRIIHNFFPAEQEKVETLIQKRLVAEAWLRRQRKPKSGADEAYQYVAGSRAILSRNVEKADAIFAKAAELGLPIAIVNRGGTRAERAGLGRVLKLEGPSSEILTGAVVSAGS